MGSSQVKEFQKAVGYKDGGHVFNLLVCGPIHSGKSSFINTVYQSLYSPSTFNFSMIAKVYEQGPEPGTFAPFVYRHFENGYDTEKIKSVGPKYGFRLLDSPGLTQSFTDPNAYNRNEKKEIDMLDQLMVGAELNRDKYPNIEWTEKKRQ